MDDLGEFERLINASLPPHREIRQASRLDQLWTALKYLAWAGIVYLWVCQIAPPVIDVTSQFLHWMGNK